MKWLGKAVYATMMCATGSWGASWHDGAGDLRIPIHVGTQGTARTAATVDVKVDYGEENARSLRVVEVDADGTIIDDATPFQFNENPKTPGQGDLVLLLTGQTPANATRSYYVYFGARPSPTVKPLIFVREDANDEGQAAFEIKTPSATLFYQKAGAGFSSVLDADGRDWVSFHPGNDSGPKNSGSADKFRGIPNMGHPTGYMHPGFDQSRSRLLSNGPLKATILSESKDGKWHGKWEITPTFARMTVLKTDAPYWFLYEGTPGGKCDPESDSWTRSDAKRGPLNEGWQSPKGGVRWAAFTDGASKRSIVFARHEDHGEPASHWLMNEEMTVFGFGRAGRKAIKKIEIVPQQFTFALIDAGNHKSIDAAIASAIDDFDISIGKVESRPE